MSSSRARCTSSATSFASNLSGSARRRAADHDSFLYALPVAALIERLFEMAGLRAKLSGGGLITRQLIARLGGVNGARVFKYGRAPAPQAVRPDGVVHQICRALADQRQDPDNPQARLRITKVFTLSPATIAPR